jgi:hypothetical protein
VAVNVNGIPTFQADIAPLSKGLHGKGKVRFLAKAKGEPPSLTKSIARQPRYIKLLFNNRQKGWTK